MKVDLPDYCPYCTHGKFVVSSEVGDRISVVCRKCGLDPRNEEELSQPHVHFRIRYYKDDDIEDIPLPGLKEGERHQFTSNIGIIVGKIHPAYECLL